MRPIRQIALAFPITVGYEEEIVLGIEDYVAQRAEEAAWSLVGGLQGVLGSLRDLKGWRGHAVLAEIRSPEEARFAGALRIPVVDLAGAVPGTGLPTVITDQRMMGRLAAEHLMQCGLRRFAFYGLKDVRYSAERKRGFADRLARDGYQAAVLETTGRRSRPRGWQHWLEELCRFLTTIPPPFGLMAVDDAWARMVTDACRSLGLHVPYHVAVVGVDNNRLACEGARPTITSVGQNARAIGHRAAALLDRLMSGRKPPHDEILVPPTGVIARESTDVAAAGDPELIEVMRFIREHLGEPFSIEQMLRAVPASRRWLEYRFRERFGRSPHAYISERRVERAKGLLLAPQPPPLQEIAGACGFLTVRTLADAFRRATGMTLEEFRAAHRAGK